MRSDFLISRVEGAGDLPLPKYMTESSAGMDLYASVKESVLLEPGAYALIPTGIKISMPGGYEAQIRPRSGLALKHGITILNAPGTIDADYRGEISTVLINLGKENFTIMRGMRIAQMVISKIEKIRFREACIPDDTVRGSGGFGHTGI